MKTTEFTNPETPPLSIFSWLSQPRRVAGIALVFATLCAYRQLFLFDPNLQAPSDIDPVEEWFFASSGGTSSLLIYGLAAWFTARRGRALFEAPTEPGFETTAIGISGILFAIGLMLWGYVTAAFQVLAPSLAVLLVSSGIFLGGATGGRSLLLPAVFLFLLGTPIPTPLLNHIIYSMQLSTAGTSVAIVGILGYPVLQSGDLIFTNWATFQVIETCAGLRMILTLVMAAFVYCELMNLESGRRIALILAAPMIGLVANYVRVVALIFNPDPQSQPEHSLQGIIMMIVGVLALGAVDKAIDFLAGKRKNANSEPNHSVQVVPTAPWRIWALTIVLASAGISSIAIEPWTMARHDAQSIHSIPREIGTWRTGQDPLTVDSEYLGSVRFSSRTWREYQRGDEIVSLFAGTNDRRQRVAGLISEKTKTLQAGSVLLKDAPIRNATQASGVRSLVIRTKNGTTLAGLHWYQNTKGLWTEVLRSMFALDRSPWRREEPARVIRISTPFDDSIGDLEDAEERLREFSVLIRRELDKLDKSP